MANKSKFMKKFLALLLFAGFSIDSGVAQTEDQLLKRFVPIFPETTGWDNFVDAFTPKDRTWGIGYGYSQSFPLTLAGNFTISCFSAALEVGVNMDREKYMSQQLNPLFCLSVAPGLYFKYFSVNCGVGCLFSNVRQTSSVTETVGENSSMTFEGDDISGSIIVDSNAHIKYDLFFSDWKCHFILSPSITGYIPICSEDYYITLNVGYNYIPKFRDLNGWLIGVGFQCVIW